MPLLPPSVRSDTPSWKQMRQQEGIGRQMNAQGLAHLLRFDWTRAEAQSKKPFSNKICTATHPFRSNRTRLCMEKMPQQETVPDTEVEIMIFVFLHTLRL